MDRHTSLRASQLGGFSLVALPLLFLGYFFAYPLLTVLLTGFTTDGSPDFGPLRTVFERKALLNVAWFTLWQAVASTLLTLIVALPAANVMARYEFPGKRLVRAAIVVPFVLPTVVVGTAFLAVLGPTHLTIWDPTDADAEPPLINTTKGRPSIKSPDFALNRCASPASTFPIARRWRRMTQPLPMMRRALSRTHRAQLVTPPAPLPSAPSAGS